MRTKMQIIFQDPFSSLQPRMPVGEIIGEAVREHELVPKEEFDDYIDKVMDDCGLQSFHKDRYPHEFSGGQRQRICIARALALKPEFIVCDEPVSALDVSIQAQIINLLKELQEQYKFTYLFISHDLSVVEHISDTVGVMYLGNLVEYGATEDIFKNPLHPYTKALFSAIPVPDPTAKMNRIVLEGSIPSPANPPAGCKFHTRCAQCMEQCKTEVPEQREIEPGHFVVCHLYVFDCLPRDRMYFMLWQNDNSIIVGKYQNTLSEINLEAVERRGIRVVRRLSGGGAVYHDMGNLNFTFITDAASGTALDMKLFCQPVVRTLAALGVHAEVNGRNDITIDGKKFSGNSQYLRQGRVMHHGTIMFNSDLSVVSEALQVDPTKFQTKGVRSVRSRVTNVADHLDRPVSLPEFRRILLENILRENPGQPYPLTPKDLAAVEKLREERYAAWDWNYGQSPACTVLRRRRVEGCGLVEAYISVDSGLISAIAFRGDFFSAVEPEELAPRFVGRTPDQAGFAAALEGVDVSRYFAGLQNDQLIEILCQA